MLKKSLLTLAALFCSGSLFAGSVDISIATTAKQDALLAKILETVNAGRDEPFATFNDYAEYILIENVKSFVRSQQELDAQTLVNAIPDNFGDVAATPYCTAASLPAGCTKGQVACFILTGSASCE